MKLFLPKISLRNIRKTQPNSSPNCWKKWLCFERYWKGRLIYITFKSYVLTLDFRGDWTKDMTATPNLTNL